MDCVRLTVDVALPCDRDGKLSSDAQGVHDAMLDLLCKAKALAVDVTPGERTTLATRHICRHADGKPCVESEELTDSAACVVEARDKLAAVVPVEPKVK